MAKLTAKARKKIPSSKFALPGKNGKPGKYPVENKSHAADALARESEMVAKGKLTFEMGAVQQGASVFTVGQQDLATATQTGSGSAATTDQTLMLSALWARS